MENLHFDKEDYFHVFSEFYGLFYKRDRKSFFLLPISYRYTRESLGQLKTEWNEFLVHCNFSFSQTSTRVSIALWKHTEYVFYFFTERDLNILGITYRVHLHFVSL